MKKRIREKMKEVHDSFIKMTGLEKKDIKCKILVRRGEDLGSELFKFVESRLPEEMKEKTPDFFHPYYESVNKEIHWPRKLDPDRESSSATEEIFHAVWGAYASGLRREPSMFENELSHYIFSAAQGKELPVEEWESKRKQAKGIIDAFDYYKEILERIKEKDEEFFKKTKESFALDQAKVHSDVLNVLLNKRKELEQVDAGELLKKMLSEGCSSAGEFGALLKSLGKQT